MLKLLNQNKIQLFLLQMKKNSAKIKDKRKMKDLTTYTFKL